MFVSEGKLLSGQLHAIEMPIMLVPPIWLGYAFQLSGHQRPSCKTVERHLYNYTWPHTHRELALQMCVLALVVRSVVVAGEYDETSPVIPVPLNLDSRLTEDAGERLSKVRSENPPP